MIKLNLTEGEVTTIILALQNKKFESEDHELEELLLEKLSEIA